MEQSVKLFNKFLCHNISVHIYSFPHFTLESFLAIGICIVFMLLHFEITNIRVQTLRLKPNTLTMCKVGSSTCREDSFTSTTVSKMQQDFHYGNEKRPSTHIAYRKITKTFSNNSQLGWVVSQNGGDSPYHNLLSEPEHVHSVVSLTPKEYVKREKERKKQENELKYCLKSLTSLYDNVMGKKLPAETIAYHIAQARENIQTAKLSNETAKYLSSNTEAMTQSLFDLLERIILNSSIDNPLPFKGNITTLICDAGNLEPKESDLCPKRNLLTYNSQENCMVKYKSDGSTTDPSDLSG